MLKKQSWLRTLAAVHSDFRSPATWIPLNIKSERALRLVRRANSTPTRVHDSVTATRTTIVTDQGLMAIVHEPTGREQISGALLWLFGGGLISGIAEHVNDVASAFAAELGVIVVVPDYRVAPEHPYPAAIDDAYATLRWLIEHAAELRIDPTNIIVGGESAGGGLAAALAQRAYDNGIPLRLQVLIAPMLDDRTVLRAKEGGLDAVLWTARSNEFGWTSYLGRPVTLDEAPPYAAAARRAHLTGLAPAFISVGGVDLFHGEVVEYAKRLEESDVPVELHVIPGAHHGVELLAPKHPATRAVQEARSQAIRRALETN